MSSKGAKVSQYYFDFQINNKPYTVIMSWDKWLKTVSCDVFEVHKNALDEECLGENVYTYLSESKLQEKTVEFFVNKLQSLFCITIPKKIIKAINNDKLVTTTP
jgi:hypothetical protein